MPVDDSIWALMVAAIGQRIDSPQGLALVDAIGAKPLRAVTPLNLSDYTVAKPLGITVSATPIPKYRAYWPERREQRSYVNYIHKITIQPPYPGPMPDGMHWGISKPELDAIAAFELRGSRNVPYWNFDAPARDVRLSAATSTNALFPPDQPATDKLLMVLAEEDDFISAYADDEVHKPLVHVECAFFTVWCALNGLLEQTRFSADVVQPLRDRSISPLAFLHGACGRLLWSGDIRPQFLEFMWLYYRGIGLPDEQTWVRDLSKVFGASNHFKDDPAQMHQDTWDNYDLIAPHIADRLGQWQRGEIKRKVREPR